MGDSAPILANGVIGNTPPVDGDIGGSNPFSQQMNVYKKAQTKCRSVVCANFKGTIFYINGGF